MVKRTKHRSVGLKLWLIIILIVLVINLAIEGITLVIKAGYNVENPVATYNCDVKWFFRFKTTIDVDGPSASGTVSGDFAYILFKKIHDPLEFHDREGNLIGRASDQYHFITQDDHSIVDSEGNVMAVMRGQFQLLGERYEIYDKEGNYIGYLKVGPTSTYGGLYDTNDRLMATYKSHLYFKDFELTIDKDAALSDETIILLFASYYSDFDADQSHSSGHSNNSKK